MKRLKLSIELVPQPLWGLNLRKLLSTKQWDHIRKNSYKKANYKCELCGQKGNRHPVECHEIWEYDDKNFIQKLEGVIALCPNCHGVKHFGRQRAIGREQYAIQHFKKVTCINNNYEVELYLNKVFGIWHKRSLKTNWRVDVKIIKDLLPEHLQQPLQFSFINGTVIDSHTWCPLSQQPALNEDAN